MDPFSAEGGSNLSSLPLLGSSLQTDTLLNTELLNIHNAFYQGQYQEVVDFDTSSFSPENTLTARVLQFRAKIALGQTEEVLANVAGEEDVPDLAAVKALAQQVSGDVAAALKAAEILAARNSD